MFREEYKKWLSSADEETKKELLSVADSEDEIKLRFSEPLSFGTAGLRGIMRAGINGMNVYTVRHVSRALAKSILQEGEDACRRGVLITFDTRNNSFLFAKEAARAISSSGIRVTLFDSPRPTPQLSFLIRSEGYFAGVNVTASHNPKEYNGYKVYWSDGAQISPEIADRISALRKQTDIFESEPLSDAEVEIAPPSFDKSFEEAVLSARKRSVGSDVSIVYTPFHGTGARYLPRLLTECGYANVLTVAEQTVPDGNFPTVKSPNPENRESFSAAIELGQKNGSDLLLGTDPDADRIGVFVRHKGEYVPLNGNSFGVLLLDYLSSFKTEEKSFAVTTIVSTPMAAALCEKRNIDCYEVYTGFKNIGGKMEERLSLGERYVFAFEESFGCLAGDYARDKDAISAALLVCDLASSLKEQGKTLIDRLYELYQEVGFFSEVTLNFEMSGLSGGERMSSLMSSLRAAPPTELGGAPVLSVTDYINGANGLAPSNVITFNLPCGKVIFRPSGTEPKVKVYLLVRGSSEADAKALIERLKGSAEEIVGRF